MYDSTPSSSQSNSCWTADSSDFSESSSSDEEFEPQQKMNFSLGRTTTSVSITDDKLFEENDEEYKYDPSLDPLDQGLFFKLLFKRFQGNFISKFTNRVNTTENLIMTSIFSKLASIPLWDKSIETYYLHAMMYWEFENESISLVQSLVSISNQIKEKSDFEEFEFLKKEVKGFLENPGEREMIKQNYNIPKVEIVNLLKANRGLVEGSIIFEEFLKE